jgi:hypothetical protein
MGIPRTVWVASIAILASVEPAYAFKANYHGDINKASLPAVSRTIDGKELKFTPKAIQEVAQANIDTDCGGDANCACVECQADPSRHFDNEAFAASSQRILRLKEAILANITAASPHGFAARADLGQALHTVEDFYAHSTWLQTRHTALNAKLGREVLDASIDPDLASPAAVVCGADHASWTDAGYSEVTTGFFQVGADDKTGTKGICWIGPELVSFGGKCRHGDFRADDLTALFGLGVCPDGISQDRPGRPYYAQAFGLSRTADVDFLDQLLDYGGEALPSGARYPAVRGNARATKALLGVRITTLGILMDTTGSMSSIQSQVKTAVGEIVNGWLGTENEPGEYLLQPFNDPDYGPVTKTSDHVEFLAKVNALSATGGGDCPELALAALLEAIDKSDPQAAFFLFTDASSKDGYLVDEVILAAQQKGIVLKFMLFGSCSPTDPAFLALAEATGGQVFVLSPSETSKVFGLVRSEVRSNPVSILSSSGTVAGSRDVAVPVDSTLTAVTFSVSADAAATIEVLRPSGAKVLATDADASVSVLSTGKIVTVTSPAAGSWRVQLTGSGAYSVAALGNGPLQVQSFQFVTAAGRAGHGSYFPIFGQPVAGTAQPAMASLAGPFRTASFKLVSATGDTLQEIALAQGVADAPADAFVGTITPPSSPFRVAVTGTDENGAAYQRLHAQLYRAQSVSVRRALLTTTVAAGTSVTVPFVVQNAGGATTYRITASDSQRFVSGVSPESVSLDAGGSARVNVTVVVPATAAQGSTDTVTVTATSAADATVTNGASATLRVDSSLATTAIDFGARPVGTPRPARSLVLRNADDQPRAIRQIAIDPGFAQTNDCGAAIPGGASCTIEITPTGDDLGTQSGSLIVVDDTPASPHVIVLGAAVMDYAVSATPGTGSLRTGGPAAFQVALTTEGAPFGDAVTLACSGLPAGTECAFDPATIAAGSSKGRSALTIRASGAAAGTLSAPAGSRSAASLGLAVAGLGSLAIAAAARRRRWGVGAALLVAVLASALHAAGCSNDGGKAPAGGTVTVTISASTGGATRAAEVTLTVR